LDSKKTRIFFDYILNMLYICNLITNARIK